jgi:hypothetical protein
MSTDYRALCAELADALNGHTSLYEGHESELVARARTALAQPEHPSDGGLTVSLRMDLSFECLKRLCDGLAAAVKPNGGYREITTDDDIASGFTGDQQVGVTWWLPEHGCDSLETTLDAIKGRLLVAVRDWLPTAVAATTTIEPVPVAERLPGPEDCDAEGLCWWWSRDITAWCLCFAADGDSSEWTHWLPHHALPIPTP